MIGQVFDDLEEIILGAGSMLAITAGVPFVRAIAKDLFADMTAPADADKISSFRTKIRAKAEQAGDKKLADLADGYVANVVSIRASGKNDAERDLALQQARKDYEAAVIKYKYDQTQQDFRAVTKDLTVDESYVFDSWLNNALTEEEKTRVLAARRFINDPDIIRKAIKNCLKHMAASGQTADTTYPQLYERWGYVETDEAWRAAWQRASKAMFDHLMTVLPQPSIMEQGGDAVSALLRGEGGRNPVVKSVRKMLGDNADERIRIAKEKLAKHRGG